MIIINYLKLYKQRKKWKKTNKHNNTYLINAYDMSLITVGRYTYGPIDVEMASRNYVLKIGSFCSIAEKVKFILSADHCMDCISTFPFKSKVIGNTLEGVSKGNIVIKDDVWIGYGSIILSGVTIGQGAVIAAGTIVTKDVPPYAVVGGNPAHIIKYRFDTKIIKQLQKIDYNKLTKESIVTHIEDLETKIENENQLNWLR